MEPEKTNVPARIPFDKLGILYSGFDRTPLGSTQKYHDFVRAVQETYHRYKAKGYFGGDTTSSTYRLPDTFKIQLDSEVHAIHEYNDRLHQEALAGNKHSAAGLKAAADAGDEDAAGRFRPDGSIVGRAAPTAQPQLTTDCVQQYHHQNDEGKMRTGGDVGGGGAAPDNGPTSDAMQPAAAAGGGVTVNTLMWMQSRGVDFDKMIQLKTTFDDLEKQRLKVQEIQIAKEKEEIAKEREQIAKERAEIEQQSAVQRAKEESKARIEEAKAKSKVAECQLEEVKVKCETENNSLASKQKHEIDILKLKQKHPTATSFRNIGGEMIAVNRPTLPEVQQNTEAIRSEEDGDTINQAENNKQPRAIRTATKKMIKYAKAVTKGLPKPIHGKWKSVARSRYLHPEALQQIVGEINKYDWGEFEIVMVKKRRVHRSKVVGKTVAFRTMKSGGGKVFEVCGTVMGK